MSMPVPEVDRKLEKESSLEWSHVKVSEPLFFKIKFRDKISYLLGTFHALPFSVLPNPVKERMKGIKTFLLEDGEMALEDQGSVSQERLKSEGVLLGPKEENYFKCLLNDIKIRLEKLLLKRSIKVPGDKIKINYLYQLLTEESEIVLTENAMDRQLVNIFKNQPVEILGLDDPYVNVDRFEDAFRDLDPYQSFYQLCHWKSMEQDSKVKFELEELIKCYCNGEIILDSFDLDEDPECWQRNLDWIPKIVYAHQFKPAPCLFAFGAAHLGGAYGILNILQQSGFKIYQMNGQNKFLPFQSKEAFSLTARQIEMQKQNYELLRHQVLQLGHPSISWLYSMDKRRREAEGYGPGAVVVYQNRDKILFSNKDKAQK